MNIKVIINFIMSLIAGFSFVAIVVFVFLFWRYINGEFFGFDTIPGVDYGANLIFYPAAIAVGIISKYLFDIFNADRAYELIVSMGAGKLIFNVVRSVVLSTIITPIVLISVVSNLDGIDNQAFRYLFCFQNGFFFQTILGRGISSR